MSRRDQGERLRRLAIDRGRAIRERQEQVERFDACPTQSEFERAALALGRGDLLPERQAGLELREQV